MQTSFGTNHPLTVKVNQTGEFSFRDQFPALKHFFMCNESAGTLVQLADVVGGVRLPPLTFTKLDAYSVTPAVISYGPLAQGNWIDLGSSPTLVLFVGNFFGGGSFTFGLDDVNTNFYDFYGGGSPSHVDSQGTRVNATIIPSFDGIYGAGFKIDFNGNLTSFQTNVSNVYAENAGVSMGVIKNLNNIDPEYVISGSGTMRQLNGIAVFKFNREFPSDLSTAIPWMVTNWSTTTNKTIYPKWRNKV